MAEDISTSSANPAQPESALQVGGGKVEGDPDTPDLGADAQAEATPAAEHEAEANAEVAAEAEVTKAAHGNDDDDSPVATVADRSESAEQCELPEPGNGSNGGAGFASDETKAEGSQSKDEQEDKVVETSATSSVESETEARPLDRMESQRDSSDDESESAAVSSQHMRSSTAQSSSSWTSSYAPLGASLPIDRGNSELDVQFAPSLEDVSRAVSDTNWWAGSHRQMYSYGDLPIAEVGKDCEPDPEHRRLISGLLRQQLSLAFAGSDRDHNHLVHMDTEVFEASLVVLHNRISEQLFPSTVDTFDCQLKHDDAKIEDKQPITEKSTEPALQNQPTNSTNPAFPQDRPAVVRLKGIFEYRVEGSATDQQRVTGYKSMLDELRLQDSIFATSQLPPELVRVFSMIDTNDDGEVTQEEFVAFVQQHAQQVVFDVEERNIPQVREARVQWCLDQLHEKHNSKMDRFFALHVMRNMLLKHKNAATASTDESGDALGEVDETLDGGGDQLQAGSSPANYPELSFQLTLNAFATTPVIQNLWYFCGCQTRAPAVVFEKAPWQDDGLTDIGLARLLVKTTKEREDLDSRVSAAEMRLAGVQDALAQLKLDFFDRRNEVRSRSGELQAVIATCHAYKVSPQCKVQNHSASNALQEVFDAARTEQYEHELEIVAIQPVDHEVMEENVDTDTENARQPQYSGSSAESSDNANGHGANVEPIHTMTAQTSTPTEDNTAKQGGDNGQEPQTKQSDQIISAPVATSLQVEMTLLARRDQMLAALRAQVDTHDSPMISLSMDFKSSFRKSLFRAQSVVGEAVEEVKQRIATAKRRQEKKAAVARSRDEAVLAALASHKALMDVIEAQKRTTLECERLKDVLEVLSKRLQEVRTAEHDLASAKADREARAAALLEKQVRRIDGLAQRPHVVGVSMHHGVNTVRDNVRASTSHQATRVRSAKHTRSVSVPAGHHSGSDANRLSHRRTSSDAFMISLSKSSVTPKSGSGSGNLSIVETSEESCQESQRGDEVQRAILRAQQELDNRQADAMAAQREQQQRRPADDLNKQKHEPLQRADRDDHRLTNDLSPLFAISAS